MSDTIFFFLIVMCAIMGFTLFLFVMYHLYLINNGTTTNERVRKNDEIDYYSKEIKNCDKLKKKFKGDKK
jgi:palmitoyltransferase